MSRQARPAFPPTPEDEASMGKQRPDDSGTALTKTIAAVDPGQAIKLGTGLDDTVGSTVDTPTSPSISSALSRFEFELGKGNEGTKVLLVEWNSSAICDTISESHNRPDEQEWVVSWDGKTSHNVLAASEGAVELDGGAKRLFFLLPPGAAIPPLVSISRGRGGSRDDKDNNKNEDNLDSKENTNALGDNGMVLWTKPMPAIYPAGLGPDVDTTGGRGVLHTLWAKQRLVSLADEIEAEMKTNSESIGLQIALQEQDWVTEHFGIEGPNSPNANLPYLPSPESPTVRAAMPRSPIGGKLGEKLRGLKLATSPADLAAALWSKPTASTSNTRSAEAANAPKPGGVLGPRPGLRTYVEPYAGFHSSLDAVIQDDHDARGNTDVIASDNAADGEDELFALPLSPRSPEMARSPFSLL